MPLRDFDQVRERIHLRVEVRHIAQGVLLVLTLVGAAFAGGVWYARQQPPAAAEAANEPAAAPAPAGLPPAAVAMADDASRATESPIYPTPVALAPAPEPPPALEAAPDAAIARAADADTPEPTAEQLATAPGERAISPAEVAAAVPAAKPPAVAPPPPNAAKPVTVQAAAPAPPPAAKAAVVAVQAPQPARPAVVAPPPVVVAKAPAPHGLGLFGTMRMAPTVALVAAAPPALKPAVVALADEKAHAPQVHKPVVRPREDDVRPPPPSGHYVIQVKAFRDAAEAKAFEADLRGKGHAPKLTSIEVPDKGTFYRVRLGPFDSLDAARAAQKQFEAAEGHMTILLGVP